MTEPTNDDRKRRREWARAYRSEKLTPEDLVKAMEAEAGALIPGTSDSVHVPRSVYEDECKRSDGLSSDLDSCQAAYAHVCDAIHPGTGPGGAAAMAISVKILIKHRDENAALREALHDIKTEAAQYGYALPPKVSEAIARATRDDLLSGPTEQKNVCQLCGFDLGTMHSCPHERGKWNIGSLDLSRGVRTGKVVTGDAEHIVQWDDDEHSLTVLVETGYLRIRPIASNAISISIDEEDDD